MANTSNELYCEPVDELSQGDVVELSPHAYLDPPLRSVLEHDGECRISALAIEALQQGSQIIASCSPAIALILNYDCEISKPATLRLVVCPIVPMSSFQPSERGNIKKNRTAHLFFLPRFGASMEDSAAVLNQLTTVHRVILSDLRRIATLTKLGRLAFYGQFVRWLTRWELRTVACPNCKIEFDPTLGLPIRSASDR